MGRVTVTFYEGFQKQPNSTKLPIDGSGNPVVYSRDFDCILWDGVSLMAPVVELVMLSGSSTYDNPALLNYTYCRIPVFGRYYWVLDWQLIDARWVATLQVDVLASFKADIANVYMFADRLADRLGPGYPVLTPLVPVDTGLPDNMLPTLSRPFITRGVMGLTWLKQGLWAGCYVIGVINADTNAVGAVSYYAMERRQFKHFMEVLLSGTYLGANMDINSETAKAILNPFQYVATCNWFPLSYADVTGNNEARTTMPLGWWNMTNIEYKNINVNGVVEKGFVIKIPKHPYSESLNYSMLDYPPYSEYTLNLPYFGSCVLTKSDFQSGFITGYVTFDLVSGLAQCRLYDRLPRDYVYPDDEQCFDIDQAMSLNIMGHCNLIRTLSAQASAPIQVAQTTSDYGAARVTQIQASAGATANSAMLARNYASAMSSAIASAAGAVGQGLLFNMGGLIGGAASAANSYMQAQVTRKYEGAAVSAQNQALRASGAYTSAVQKAPKVETSGNNGSVMESYFPAELVGTYLIPSTITNHNYEAYEGFGDITDTQRLLQWVGYAHGQMITVGEHSGYIQGHDPIFYSSRALAPEVDQIKEYIQEGFFYE